MREDAGFVGLGILDVVGQLAGRRIEASGITHSLGDFMVGAGRITADTQPPNSQLGPGSVRAPVIP